MTYEDEDLRAYIGHEVALMSAEEWLETAIAMPDRVD